MSEQLVEIGELGRAHGIRGEIRISYYAESAELLRGEVYLKAGNLPPRRVEVLSFRRHQGGLLALFAGHTDRTSAETLRGQTLLVPESALPDSTDEEIYLYEVIGCTVVLDATEQEIGRLDHVLFHSEQEVWCILTPEGKEVYLPAVPDFVADIDLDAARIRITPPEGLLELYL